MILGAGMSGLCMAIELKRAGVHDFVILEKSAGLGGTWWDNRYPGAQVDVPAPLYSFSFAPNPLWKRRFADAAEIQAYMLACAQAQGVLPHIRFGTTLRSASFDERSDRWQLCTAADEPFDAQFFVCSTGPLSRLRWPDVPGLNDYRGRRLHSSRWDAGLALQGQRVGVIGTGSTACQLIPPLAQVAAQLHVFQRTANWVLPRLDRPYNALDRALVRLPLYARAVRAFWFNVLEMGRRGFEEGSFMRRAMLANAARHLQRQVSDAALRERLTPPYALGCKRLVYSNEFYPALMQPNVELVTDAISRVTATGIVTVDGAGQLTERPLDVLVCATGFDVQHSLAEMHITGRNGQTLDSAFADGPVAQLGLTVAGFPNLFLMLGPNTATGHTSTLLYIEPGVRWAVRAMQEVARRGLRSIDIKAAVMQAYNDGLQARLAGSVWAGCRSWYRSDSGRVIAIFPGFTREYVKAVEDQRFEDFVFA